MKVAGNGYQADQVYTVVSVGTNNSTLMASDSTGRTGSWVRWDNTEPAIEIGFEFLKQHLPAASWELLSAFDGILQLRLKDEIRDQILITLPDLKTRVLLAQMTLDQRNAASFVVKDQGNDCMDPDDDNFRVIINRQPPAITSNHPSHTGDHSQNKTSLLRAP